jgi:hypothetical protein
MLGLLMLAGLAASCSHTPRGPVAGGNAVEFRINAPGAGNVILVLLPSGRNGMGARKYPARVSGEDVWLASLELAPGEYRYFFMVDSNIQVAGAATRVEKDDFGGTTGILFVTRKPDGTLSIY